MDRNSIASASMRVSITSLSARRAWIEISSIFLSSAALVVALRKESVDRNTSPHSINSMTHSRSPQGERG